MTISRFIVVLDFERRTADRWRRRLTTQLESTRSAIDGVMQARAEALQSA